jgi:hypothetical protein
MKIEINQIDSKVVITIDKKSINPIVEFIVREVAESLEKSFMNLPRGSHGDT